MFPDCLSCSIESTCKKLLRPKLPLPEQKIWIFQISGKPKNHLPVRGFLALIISCMLIRLSNLDILGTLGITGYNIKPLNTSNKQLISKKNGLTFHCQTTFLFSGISRKLASSAGLFQGSISYRFFIQMRNQLFLGLVHM